MASLIKKYVNISLESDKSMEIKTLLIVTTYASNDDNMSEKKIFKKWTNGMCEVHEKWSSCCLHIKDSLFIVHQIITAFSPIVGIAWNLDVFSFCSTEYLRFANDILYQTHFSKWQISYDFKLSWYWYTNISIWGRANCLPICYVRH